MIRSLYSRLLLSHFAVILVTAAILGLMMSWLVRNHAVETKKSDLLAQGYAAISLLEPALRAGRLPDDRAWQSLNELTGVTLWIMDREGAVLVGQPPEGWSKRIAELPENLDQLFQGRQQTWLRTSRKYQDRSIVAAFPVSLNSAPAALFLYAPITGINRTAQALETLLLYSLLAGLGAAALLGFVMSRSLNRPIANISQAATDFANGNFSSRTTVAGQDELGQLGQTFNTMAESLSRIDQNRRDFLATVSHELKTPVASIQALTEALQDGLVKNPADQQRYLATIGEQTARMARLIHDLLDLSQLEQGKVRLEKAPLDLQEFLQTECFKYQPLLTDKALTLAIHSPSVTVHTDRDRVSQILGNLLSNAIRYAPPGSSISIEVEVTTHQALISVTDKGSGIAEKHLPYIWERFYRADSSRSRSGGGSGLGLAVVKKLTEALGGDISVSSRPGETKFTFSLPLS